MLHTLGVVDVHALAGHALAARRLGNHTLLEWVIRRISESQLLEHVLVMMDDDPDHHRVARLLPPSVLQSTAPASARQLDPLARLTAAARDHGAEAIVRVDIAFPFVDPVYIDRLVTTACGAAGCDYISYCRGFRRGAVQAQLGVFGEWCRVTALERANVEARHELDRSDPLRYVRSHPELFGMRLIPIPAALDREDMRLTIDGEDDWNRTELIFDALGPEAFDWQRVTGLMDHQPEMRQQMADLNRGRE